MTITNQKNSGCCIASVLLILSLDVSSAFAPQPRCSPSLSSPSSSSFSTHRFQPNKPFRLYALKTEEEAKNEQKEEILNEASEALTSVGWSAPMAGDELTSDDPFVQKINAQIQEESGVNLDELLNPAKVGWLVGWCL